MSELPGPPPRIAILGGGISGLACAYWLKKLDPQISLTLFEKDSRLGGKLHTLRKDGFLVENAPYTLYTSRATTRELLEDLQPQLQFLKPGPAATRSYVFSRGQFHKLPTTTWEFLNSRLLTIKGKIRLLGEPFVTPQNSDATVLDYATRRFGLEFTRTMIGSVANSVYASDISKASVENLFPGYFYPPQKRGSLFRHQVGEFFRQEGSGIPGMAQVQKMTGFVGGLGQLKEALELYLRGQGVIFRTNFSADPGGFFLPAGNRTNMDYDLCISCLPGPDLKRFLEGVAPSLAHLCSKIKYAPLTLVYLGFPKRNQWPIGASRGFLVPASEEKKITGGVFLSNLYEGQAP